MRVVKKQVKIFNYRRKFIGFDWKKVVKYSSNFESSEGYE
jgi:hypothetical protein